MYSESGRDRVMGLLTWAGLIVITLTPSSCNACAESRPLHQTQSAYDALTRVPDKVLMSGESSCSMQCKVQSYLQNTELSNRSNKQTKPAVISACVS